MASLQPIAVLIVDDSFFMRKTLRAMLEAEHDIVVVGEAKDAQDAITLSQQLRPDIITMDYLMPGMDGAQATRQILSLLQDKPSKIIMISAHTEDDAANTLTCLRAGAVDYIQKPSGEISVDMTSIQNEIVNKVRVAARSRVVTHPPEDRPSRQEKTCATTAAQACVVIGASTGGPPVVEQVLCDLPADIPATVIVVQHMPAYFTGPFAKRLDGLTPLCIGEVVDTEVLQSSRVYVVHGGTDMEIVPNRNDYPVIRVKKKPQPHHIHPSIDVTMTSAARIFKKNMIAVVLTGMGDDGLEGTSHVRKHGGRVIVQDPETAVVDSMPRHVIAAGQADEVLPPDEIAKEIVKRVAA